MNKNVRRLLRKKIEKSSTGGGHQNVSAFHSQNPLPPFQAQRKWQRNGKTILSSTNIFMSQIVYPHVSGFERGEGFLVKKNSKKRTNILMSNPGINFI